MKREIRQTDRAWGAKDEESRHARHVSATALLAVAADGHAAHHHAALLLQLALFRVGHHGLILPRGTCLDGGGSPPVPAPTGVAGLSSQAERTGSGKMRSAICPRPALPVSTAQSYSNRGPTPVSPPPPSTPHPTHRPTNLKR